MGTSQSSYEQKFHKKYTFIQPLKDSNFGQIKIYRKKQLNFDYLMILQRSVQDNQIHNFTKYIEAIQKSLTGKDQPLILRIFHYSIDVHSKSTCSNTYVRLYIEYFNFTLKDVIQLHRLTSNSFTIQQVLYVINSAISIYYLFRRMGANYLNMRSDCVLVTPEGYVRFSPVRGEDFVKEQGYCSGFGGQGNAQVHFQKSQRQLLIQIKHLLLQMVSLCPCNDDHFITSYQLLMNINHSRTLDNVQKFLWKTQVDCLNLKIKTPEFNDISTNREKNDHYHSSLASKSKWSIKDNQHKQR